MTRHLCRCALAALTLALAASCAAPSRLRPFALRPVMWEDPDRRPFGPRPAEVYNPYMWDTIDNIVFRQLSDVFRYELDREAVNVNALDEVPDSSWWTNRIGRRAMSRDELLLGPCPTLEPPPTPWRIVRGKPDGSSPGAVIEAADGNRYLFKVDFRQPERATAADAIVVRILHAVGYFAPCNQVVFFDRDDIVVDPDARMGDDAYDAEDLQQLIEAAGPGPNGQRRGSLSLFIDGVPLGGWRFDGRRADDPNDVIDHEHRRETRGMYVLSSWLNHIDSRAENNMSAWIETGDGRGYVRHYVLDAGDSFGISWEDPALVRRFGYSHYLDLQHVAEELLTLGIPERPWTDPPRGPAYEALGYYSSVEGYVPDEWRNGYPNPAFERRTERDMAWMARILSRFERDELAALVTLGRFSNPMWGDELARVLWERRERVLERWLTRLSPLTDPEVRDGRLCLTDLAVRSGLRDAAGRRYRARAFDHPELDPIGIEGAWTRRGAEVCVPLPRQPIVGGPEYLIVDVVAASVGRETTAPVRVHLYELEEGTWQIAGLERPYDDAPPR